MADVKFNRRKMRLLGYIWSTAKRGTKIYQLRARRILCEEFNLRIKEAQWEAVTLINHLLSVHALEAVSGVDVYQVRNPDKLKAYTGQVRRHLAKAEKEQAIRFKQLNELRVSAQANKQAQRLNELREVIKTKRPPKIIKPLREGIPKPREAKTPKEMIITEISDFVDKVDALVKQPKPVKTVKARALSAKSKKSPRRESAFDDYPDTENYADDLSEFKYLWGE